MKITIGHLYPELLNLYGDRGNIASLRKRLEWRGIEAEVREYRLADSVDFENLDIVFLGGGSDREQLLIGKRLRVVKKDFREYVERDGVTVAICGGYQILGHYYKLKEDLIEGLSILDIFTESEKDRLIGDVVVQTDLFARPVVGFENHSGRTYIQNHTPLGKIMYGSGNNGRDGSEGVIYKNLIGTYLHGPLFPKNPQLCDYLLEKALRRKYGETAELTPLNDDIENSANDYMVRKYLSM